MKLAELQETMLRAVTGEGALEETAALVQGGPLEPADRVGIYAEMYWLRMRDALRSDYPLVLRILGEEAFDVLVARHVRRRPSIHYSLGRLGVGVADTLREAPMEQKPWLEDLAALEWARAESFVAVDAPVLSAAELSGMTEDSFTRAKLVASPSLRLVRLSYDLRSVWRALEADGPSEVPGAPGVLEGLEVPEEVVPVVVWRKGFEVFHVAVGAEEARALSGVLGGQDIPSVCEAFADGPEPVAAAFQAIGSWIAEGMMSEVLIEPG